MSRQDPDPERLVDGVHPYPLSQPLPEKTKTRQDPEAFESTGTVEASRAEDTAAQQEKERADGETDQP